MKKLINCILENGAYSEKNEIIQISKKGDNYTPKEKTLVKMSWRYRNYLGRIMQDEILTMLNSDLQFMEELKKNDVELYNSFKKLVGENEGQNA